MADQVDRFKYHEEFGEYDGWLTVTSPADLFGSEEIELLGGCNSKPPLSAEALNTVNFLKKEFHHIYKTVLETLFTLQEDGLIKWEVFNEENYSFSPITFSSSSEIHSYIGKPVFRIRPETVKNGYTYLALTFYKDNQLSIEHGITFVFWKNDLIHLDFTDDISTVDGIYYYEKDPAKWKEGLWRVMFEAVKERTHNDKDLIRSRWLQEK
ncbi:hypothetical protein A8F94_09540 [Bacillus sp. FJAT-27225]|uniref:hypothetical protein n=1 Tax=Bacillus sp. FJAT-27225 TaxID=1743144 RepID=UPI00080C22CF|nr:hypothetical protein [Bacillus sp. FJAT-27225]OCA88054.1 hypothetical protein A8F94_09540 [Bacillus sp. FJAT-27225]